MPPLLSRRSLLVGVLAIPAVARAQATEASARVRCSFAGHDFTYRLAENPTVTDFISLLPLDLTIMDFLTNEKIAHLPRRLVEAGLVDINFETPGDLCYFLGWGSLASFHDSYVYRRDLIRRGRIEGGVAPLLVRGEFPLRLELINPSQEKENA